MSKLNDKRRPIRIGVSQGDINSISYEIIIKTFMDPRMQELASCIVYGSSKISSYHRKALRINDFSFNVIKTAEQANPKRPNILNITEEDVKVELGKPTELSGKMAYASLEAAVADLKRGAIDVLVTGPINKSNIQSDSFHFPGHTEYLATEFNAQNHLMLMVSGNLHIGVITGHIPIEKVSEALTPELIRHKIDMMHQSLVQDFGIRRPRIALLGLNPHASDDGLLGREENEVIIPAIKKAFDDGMLIYGPYPADGFFGSDTYHSFDGVLAMYHDQGMLPFKTLSFHSGVNFTAGLPIIRTSPAHGTAFELAGKDKASPESFREAVYLALDIYENRSMYEDLNSDPLRVVAPENSANTNGMNHPVNHFTRLNPLDEGQGSEKEMESLED